MQLLRSVLLCAFDQDLEASILNLTGDMVQNDSCQTEMVLREFRDTRQSLSMETSLMPDFERDDLELMTHFGATSGFSVVLYDRINGIPTEIRRYVHCETRSGKTIFLCRSRLEKRKAVWYPLHPGVSGKAGNRENEEGTRSQ